MIFLPNPPEADKFLRLPREMRSLFLWGYAQKIILLRRINPRNIKNMPVVIFITCLDLEQKSSFVDGHEHKFLISHEIFNY
jgi:hypothetical protein